MFAESIFIRFTAAREVLKISLQRASHIKANSSFRFSSLRLFQKDFFFCSKTGNANTELLPFFGGTETNSSNPFHYKQHQIKINLLRNLNIFVTQRSSFIFRSFVLRGNGSCSNSLSRAVRWLKKIKIGRETWKLLKKIHWFFLKTPFSVQDVT